MEEMTPLLHLRPSFGLQEDDLVLDRQCEALTRPDDPGPRPGVPILPRFHQVLIESPWSRQHHQPLLCIPVMSSCILW
jgi:hypothetical protein